MRTSPKHKQKKTSRKVNKSLRKSVRKKKKSTRKSTRKSIADGMKRKLDVVNEAHNVFLYILEELMKGFGISTSYNYIFLDFFTEHLSMTSGRSSLSDYNFKSLHKVLPSLQLNDWLSLYDLMSKISLPLHDQMVNYKDVSDDDVSRPKSYEFSAVELDYYSNIMLIIKGYITENIKQFVSRLFSERLSSRYTPERRRLFDYDMGRITGNFERLELVKLIDIRWNDDTPIPDILKPWIYGGFGYSSNLERFRGCANLQRLILRLSEGDVTPLGNSFEILPNLFRLDFKGNSTISLGNSLSVLSNLRELELVDYVLPLNDSLRSLTNLRELTLLNPQPLGDSLDELRNLQSLQLTDYSHPLETSLNRLTNLRKLRVNSRSFQFQNSLDNLINLEELYLYPIYRLDDVDNVNIVNNPYPVPLGHSLDNLRKLKILGISGYDHPLGDSLRNLTNLESLTVDSFNHPLGDSLKPLRELRNLTLESFNHPLGDSLKPLRKLEKLYLPKFDHPLGDSLKSLQALIDLILREFKKPLLNSLHGLSQLKYLFIYFYPYPIGDSLKGLLSLKMLDCRANDTSSDAIKRYIGVSQPTTTEVDDIHIDIESAIEHAIGNNVANVQFQNDAHDNQLYNNLNTFGL